MKRWIHAAHDLAEDDLYVVKIWHEVEANGADTYGPEVAEEVFQIVATSPREAIEEAKRQWAGPIDRIEIVAVNPEDADEDLPFINGSSNVTASSKLSVDNFADYYSPDYYPEYDPKRLEDAQGIDWYINIEDPEFIIDDIKDFPDLSVIKEVRYFDDDQQDWAEDNGWDGGYNIRYNDGSIKQFAWHMGSSKMYELGPDEYGNWKYYRSANDSKYAQMQTELQEDRINRAGSYSRYIANR